LRQEGDANAVSFGTFVRLAVEDGAVTTRLRVVAKAIALLRTIERCGAFTADLRRTSAKDHEGHEGNEGGSRRFEELHHKRGVLPAGGPTRNHATLHLTRVDRPVQRQITNDALDE
jgi:hypothetical protein